VNRTNELDNRQKFLDTMSSHCRMVLEPTEWTTR